MRLSVTKSRSKGPPQQCNEKARVAPGCHLHTKARAAQCTPHGQKIDSSHLCRLMGIWVSCNDCARRVDNVESSAARTVHPHSSLLPLSCALATTHTTSHIAISQMAHARGTCSPTSLSNCNA